MRSEVGFGALLLFVACGDSGETEMMLPTTVERAEFCSVVAEAECARLEMCGHLSAPLDRAACAFRQTEVLCIPVLREAERAGTQVVYDADRAARCRDEIAAVSCAVGIDHAFFAGPECSGVVSGRGQDGDPCRASFACANGHYCSGNIGPCPGVCTLFAEANEICGPERICSEGLFCSLTQKRCRAPVGRGQICELSLFGNACQKGSYCDTSQLGSPMCVQVRGVGGACASAFECASLRCADGRCTEGQAGESCASHADCDTGLRCQSGRCFAPLLLDAACTPAGAPCAEGLTCTSSGAAMLCQPGAGLGDPCDGACYLSRCVDGACAALAFDGGACTVADDCLPGRACIDGACGFSNACWL